MLNAYKVVNFQSIESGGGARRKYVKGAETSPLTQVAVSLRVALVFCLGVPGVLVKRQLSWRYRSRLAAIGGKPLGNEGISLALSRFSGGYVA